jgi:hypothetical protein
MATEELTEREREMLGHLRKAQELGSTLADYASSAGVEVRELYESKRRLVRKGAIQLANASPRPGWGRAVYEELRPGFTVPQFQVSGTQVRQDAKPYRTTGFLELRPQQHVKGRG